MMEQMVMSSAHLIVKIDPYHGKDTYISCGLIGEEYDTSEQPLFLIVDSITGSVLDCGYRSFQEAITAWPKALNASTVL